MKSMLSFFIAIYLLARSVTTFPTSPKHFSTGKVEFSRFANPIFDGSYDDEDDYDDEEEFSGNGDEEDVYKEPPRNKKPSNLWKINMNKTKNDTFIIQGDIRLSLLQKLRLAPIFDLSRRKRRAARSKEPEYLWRYNTIYYKIDKNLDRETKKEIKKGIREWKKKEMKNCLKFVRLDRDPKLEARVSEKRFGGGPVHHILLTKGDGCWSNVGRVDTQFQNEEIVLGRQIISIGSGCGEKGTVVHEIGHAIGFWHEQSRRDRDSFIKIVKGNILYGQKRQFKRMAANQVGSMGYAYDFWSIMHYGAKFFTSNGKPTIKVLKKYKYLKPNIGQRSGLSYLDIAQARAMYKCNIIPSRESKRECLDKKTKGSDYSGSLDYTKNGIMCQPWNKQYPHKHNYKLYSNNNGLGNHNYCRNPGGEKKKPWCFTTLGEGENVWEYCDLQFCKS